MIHKQFVILSRNGEKLRADLRYVATPAFSRRGQGVVDPRPVIIFLHGFKGFKDWGPFPTMMERLAHAGFVTIAFNFSHNGVGDDLLNITELDRFAQTTFTRDIEEVQDVIRVIASGEGLPIDECEINRNRIGLMGHSRGAATAILAASKSTSVKAVVALAPVASFERWTERQAEVWKREGYTEITNQRTGQIMRLNRGLLDDFEMHREELDILIAAESLAQQQKPLLVVAGSEDLTAPVAESQSIADAARGERSELAIIPRTGHTFGTEHPFAGMTPAFEKVIELTSGFFNRYL